MFKKILTLINQFFGILFFLSFFGTFVSIFIFTHFMIQNHYFTTGAVLITLVFFSFLITFILKPILKDGTGMQNTFVSKKNYYPIIIIISLFLLLFGYFTIYQPLTSQFLGAINLNMKQSVDNNIIVRAKSGTEIYFQFDVSQFVEDGTKVEVIITGPDNWTTNKTYTIAKKDLNDDSNVTSGTETTSSLEKLPKDGEYNISIRQLDIKTLIKRVVVLGK